MAAKLQKLITTVPRLVQAGQTVAAPRLQTFWKYARVELTPPSPSEWPQIAKGFSNLASAAKSQKWRTLTVKEAFINTVVATEIACWFFVGECIGKGTLIGYQVHPNVSKFGVEF